MATGLPTETSCKNHVWQCDFVINRTTKGDSIRMLTAFDSIILQCLCILAERRINATKVRSILSEPISCYGGLARTV